MSNIGKPTKVVRYVPIIEPVPPKRVPAPEPVREPVPAVPA